MKTWEMIKKLSENPKLTFRNQRFGGVVGYMENGALSWIKNAQRIGEEFTIHCLDQKTAHGNWDDDWELEREPVDFMTAVNSGKRIRPIDHTVDGFLHMDEWAFDLEMINGKWFIE